MPIRFSRWREWWPEDADDLFRPTSQRATTLAPREERTAPRMQRERHLHQLWETLGLDD